MIPTSHYLQLGTFSGLLHRFLSGLKTKPGGQSLRIKSQVRVLINSNRTKTIKLPGELGHCRLLHVEGLAKYPSAWANELPTGALNIRNEVALVRIRIKHQISRAVLMQHSKIHFKNKHFIFFIL